jgi:hypothetical protein
MQAAAALTAAAAIALAASCAADGWVHPAGLIDASTLDEVRQKLDTLEWARNVLSGLDRGGQPWLKQSPDRLAELMPDRRMQVYWLLMCPDCREQLPFDPLNDTDALCAHCNQRISLDQASPAAPPDSAYAGTLYEGWGCHYLLHLAHTAEHLALLHALGGPRSYAERAAHILRLYADRTRALPVAGGGSFRMIWTYAYEGDCSILLSLVTAYELIRDVPGLLGESDHQRIRTDLLKYWCDSVFRVEQDHSQRHNNTYRYLMLVALIGCAIEDADYIDWAFGQRAYSLERRPEHRSLAWLGEHNYLDDGAFWGLCSAYHLYALGPHCQAVMLGQKLSRQMPDLFPPELYDEMHPGHARGQTLRRAIEWFTAQSLPDLTMAPFGDMGGRVSLATYPLTAEIGYRYLGVEEVGSYRSLREGNRGLVGLLYGADAIEERPWEYRSANLRSGYVALRREHQGNRLYAGLNALRPGSGHSHADRLNLITYSRDRLLTGEKRTRYDDPDQRVYSGASYGHNTVTVDETSQLHGDKLTGDRVPRIETFVDLPGFSAAEAWGDKVYEQTSIYRRALVQFDEYLVDIFRVEGGAIHDWFFHGIGEAPEVSLPLEAREGFEPAMYVVRGGRAYRSGTTDETFSVTWRIPAEEGAEFPGRTRDVYSMVTLAGGSEQDVRVLETYPNPGPHSLMVRRRGGSSCFTAVHEAYHDEPVVADVRSVACDGGSAVEVRHADDGRRGMKYGSGQGENGLTLDGAFGFVELDAEGKVVALGLLRGRLLSWDGLRLEADGEACLSMVWRDAAWEIVSSPAVAYYTVEGEPVYAEGEDMRVQLTLGAERSPTGRAAQFAGTAPGQTQDGPRARVLR